MVDILVDVYNKPVPMATAMKLSKYQGMLSVTVPWVHSKYQCLFSPPRHLIRYPPDPSTLRKRVLAEGSRQRESGCVLPQVMSVGV